jgi:hypothetical protein
MKNGMQQPLMLLLLLVVLRGSWPLARTTCGQCNDRPPGH